MDMLVLGIGVPDYYIGLFSITHMFHIFFRDFIEGCIVKMFAMGKVQTYMRIAVFGSVTLSLKMEYTSEKLRRYALGNSVAVTEYFPTFFSENIVQCSGTGFAIN